MTFTPDPAAVALMSGDSMDATKAPAIVEQVNTSTRQVLRGPDRADGLSRLGP